MRLNWSALALFLVVASFCLLAALISKERKENLAFFGELLHNLFVDLPRALLFSREASIHVQATSRESLPLVLRLQRYTRVRGLSSEPIAVESWNTELARPELTDAYAAASTALPKSLVTAINGLLRGFIVHRQVPVVVARADAVLPWEAYLSLSLATTSTTRELWFYRPVSASRSARRDSHRGSTSEVTLRHDARNRWSQEPWSASSYREVGHAAVVHAIGLPQRMASGIRLQISRETVKDVVWWDMSEPASFIIFQLPIVDSLVRASTDRQQVADLRELAYDVAQSGAVFVLVLPALTKEDAVLLITALARRLGRKEPTLDLLLSITEHLRSLLLRPKDPHAAELAELAFDITLFAADTAPLPGGKTTK